MASLFTFVSLPVLSKLKFAGGEMAPKHTLIISHQLSAYMADRQLKVRWDFEKAEKRPDKEGGNKKKI